MTTPTPSELIRRFREARNLTVSEFAALLGYSSATVREWESGAPVPSEVLKRLAEI